MITTILIIRGKRPGLSKTCICEWYSLYDPYASTKKRFNEQLSKMALYEL